MSVFYATRDDFKSTLDFRESARNNAQIDRALDAASRAVELVTHRVFYPTKTTRTFDFPDDYARSPSWRLWLDQNELVSATTITSGGTAVTSYFLEPNNDGPPYDRVEIDRGTNSVFSSGDTRQRAVSIVGVFGYDDSVYPVTTLAEALDAVETGIDVNNSAQCGVGALLTVGTEKMIVTAQTSLATGLTLSGNVAAQDNVVLIPFTGSGTVNAGELITVGSERMAVEDVLGSNIVVRRAADGSVLAAHVSTDVIYAPRTLTVERGALGTTAATASLSATVSRQRFPGLVIALALAEAENFYLQESSGYARVSGQGENATTFSQAGLNKLREQCRYQFGRPVRTRAV